MKTRVSEVHNLRGVKKFTAATIADRMSYWMKKSPQELFDSQEDTSISALDQVCIGALLTDIKYGRMKNLDLMLSRIVGTPVNQTILQNKVEMAKPVSIELVGVEVGDEDSLKKLEDLRASTEDASTTGSDQEAVEVPS